MNARYTRRHFRLTAIFALAVGEICIWAAPAAEPAVTAATPHLSAVQVSLLARDELVRNKVTIDRFEAKAPTYYPDRKKWWVFFIQNKPPFIPDGDILVVIDDVNRKACMEY